MTNLEQLVSAFTSIGYPFVVLESDGYSYVVLCDENEIEELKKVNPDYLYDRAYFEFNPDGTWASTP